MESATKFIGGHGTTIGGVIIDGGTFDWAAHAEKFPQLTQPNPSYHGISFVQAAGPAAFITRIRAILLRDTGSTLSPFHNFIFLQGLETLSLRVDRHVENTLKVIEYLKTVPEVESISHPSLSEDPEQKRLYNEYFPNGAGSIFTFLTSSPSSSTRQAQPTQSSAPRSSSTRASMTIRFACRSVRSISTTSLKILPRHLQDEKDRPRKLKVQTGCSDKAFSRCKASIFVRKTLQVLPCEIKKALAF